MFVWRGGEGGRGDRGGPPCRSPCPNPSDARLLPHPIPSTLSRSSQLDDGVQNTGTRKFLTVLPVATFLLASHGTAWERQVRETRGKGMGRKEEEKVKRARHSPHVTSSSRGRSHTSVCPSLSPLDQPLALNALALILCLVPKLPAMHRVRIFGINRW